MSFVTAFFSLAPCRMDCSRAPLSSPDDLDLPGLKAGGPGGGGGPGAGGGGGPGEDMGILTNVEATVLGYDTRDLSQSQRHSHRSDRARPAPPFVSRVSQTDNDCNTPVLELSLEISHVRLFGMIRLDSRLDSFTRSKRSRTHKTPPFLDASTFHVRSIATENPDPNNKCATFYNSALENYLSNMATTTHHTSHDGPNRTRFD